MRMYPLLSILLTFQITACSSRGQAAHNPGSPTPVADPAPGPERSSPPQADPGRSGTGGPPDARAVPLRPAQAPLLSIRDVLEVDSLLGLRVRVRGRCTAFGEGPRAGSWTLEETGMSIEVRGLVPSSCKTSGGEELTIFAQIEPKSAGSRDRLLLRLPD
jgi:hypothetical protein